MSTTTTTTAPAVVIARPVYKIDPEQPSDEDRWWTVTVRDATTGEVIDEKIVDTFNEHLGINLLQTDTGYSVLVAAGEDLGWYRGGAIEETPEGQCWDAWPIPDLEAPEWADKYENRVLGEGPWDCRDGDGAPMTYHERKIGGFGRVSVSVGQMVTARAGEVSLSELTIMASEADDLSPEDAEKLAALLVEAARLVRQVAGSTDPA